MERQAERVMKRMKRELWEAIKDTVIPLGLTIALITGSIVLVMTISKCTGMHEKETTCVCKCTKEKL